MTPPSPPSIDILALGNAIVDVLSHVDDAQIDALPVNKGGMTLVGAQEATDLYAVLGPGVECSGGSAANTVVGAAMLGARTAFIGRVRDDQLGQVFTHDIRAAGVQFDTAPATAGPDTAVCLVMVTPDAHRTMCTHLGASIELGPDDVDDDLVRGSAVTSLEGYLWDPPGAKEAMRKADPTLLEPVMAVEVVVPDEYMGDVIGDLNSRRGKILNMTVRHGLQVIKADVPLATMFGYSTALRSSSQGRATYSMEFSHYEPVPPNVAEEIKVRAGVLIR